MDLFRRSAVFLFVAKFDNVVYNSFSCKIVEYLVACAVIKYAADGDRVLSKLLLDLEYTCRVVSYRVVLARHQKHRHIAPQIFIPRVSVASLYHTDKISHCADGEFKSAEFVGVVGVAYSFVGREPQRRITRLVASEALIVSAEHHRIYKL